MFIATHYCDSRLLETLSAYADAGVEPAFDADMEELDRQFAELRMTIDNR
jgi:hypothetical protein